MTFAFTAEGQRWGKPARVFVSAAFNYSAGPQYPEEKDVSFTDKQVLLMGDAQKDWRNKKVQN
jgi:hypothetical protein